ncbi:MAG TPA: PASTA domain-containing protein [Anaerolineales bacterium]|nr:PASTA domain-containing protein [Anaerolineales bacterium]
MSHRVVFPHILSVYALPEFWRLEQIHARFDIYGETQRVRPFSDGMEVLHLRWLLNPAVGLPLEPFLVHRRPVEPAPLTAQEYAELDDWQLVDVVGLPVDGSWDSTGYNTGGQGLVDPTDPFIRPLPPQEAALDRLIAGAPFTGWHNINDRGQSLPSWEQPDLKAFLLEQLAPGFLENVRQMLENEPDPEKHAEYRPTKRKIDLPLQAGYLGDRRLQAQQSTLDAPPWKVALLNAGSDPFASLALGFGTLIPFDFESVYMVSVFHQHYDREFAAVLLDLGSTKNLEPEPPEGVRAVLRARSRPAKRNEDYADSVDVLWKRPKQPGLQPDPTRTPLGYSVTRLGPQQGLSEILLARRPGDVQGWVPIVGNASGDGQEVRFNERRLESGFRALPQSCTYSVAAQDLFGRWSEWRSTDYQLEAEPSQGPKLVSVQLDPDGKLIVDFAWDWSDRSPGFVEISGRFSDPPSSDFVNQRIQFGGGDVGLFDPQQGQVDPLDPGRKGAVSWGEEQDADPAEPGTRYYRLTRLGIQIPFNLRETPVIEVKARGQGFLHQVFSSGFGPGFGITPWSQPLQVSVQNSRAPEFSFPIVLPPPQEPPQWASLPDISGTSRALLRWPTMLGLRSIIYTASETALLAAADRPGPDLNKPYPGRVADLRAILHRPDDLRRVFQRLTNRPVENGEFEAVLPRGSRVIHAYAITAINSQQMESAWPQDRMQFLLVAAPRLSIPTEPELQIDLENGELVARVRLRGGAPVDRVELFRTSNEGLAQDGDTMGPPIAELIPDGAPVLEHRQTLPPSWRRIYYRAVAWSRDNPLTGEISARSPASPAVSVLLPPQAVPEVIDLRVNGPGSSDAEALVSWTSQAPVEVTPLGPHTVILEARTVSGDVITRLEESLHTLPMVASLFELPPADPVDPKIIRVGPSEDYRLYAWLPRPLGLSFRLTVKIIDPLGRIGSAHQDVHQLALLHPPQLGSISFSFDPILSFGEPGDARSHWEILSPVQQDALDRYHFSVEIDRFIHQEGGTILIEFPIEIELSLAQIDGPSPQRVEHIPGTQVYFIQHVFGAERTDLTVTVKLTDPLSQSASQTASLSVVSVPDVEGQTLAEAQQKLIETGLTPEVALVALLSGVVIVERLEPRPGTPRPVGSVVVIFPTVPNPDIDDGTDLIPNI